MILTIILSTLRFKNSIKLRECPISSVYRCRGAYLSSRYSLSLPDQVHHRLVPRTEPHLAVAGCASGLVALFDTRLSGQASRVGSWREHQAFVVTSELRTVGGTTTAVTGE